MIFVKLACGERDIVVSISVRCMCMLCVCASVQICRTKPCTFVHEFQNYLAQLMSSRSRSETFVQVG